METRFHLNEFNYLQQKNNFGVWYTFNSNET